MTQAATSQRKSAIARAERAGWIVRDQGSGVVVFDQAHTFISATFSTGGRLTHLKRGVGSRPDEVVTTDKYPTLGRWLDHGPVSTATESFQAPDLSWMKRRAHELEENMQVRVSLTRDSFATHYRPKVQTGDGRSRGHLISVAGNGNVVIELDGPAALELCKQLDQVIRTYGLDQQ